MARLRYPGRKTFPQELRDFLAQVPEHQRRLGSGRLTGPYQQNGRHPVAPATQLPTS